MLEKVENIATLIRKYHRNELTAEETTALNEWLSESEEYRKLLTELSFDNIMKTKMKTFLESEIPGGWEKVQQLMDPAIPIPEKGSRSIFTFRNIAACLLALTLGAWFYASVIPGKVSKVAGTTDRVQSHPVLLTPAHKAALKTADSATIALHNLKDGPVKIEGAFKVIKSKGYLSYIPDPVISTEETLYNTITTPRGGHYRIVLPDSSIISMNVASSVTFKVSSAGSIREVSMTGEAEFDITTNPDEPFIVSIMPQNSGGKAARVKVTGTRFNINGYSDKKITLLEGSLFVMALSEGDLKSKNKSQPPGIELKMGEQAQINDNGRIDIIHDVDTSGVVAWKNGSVKFTKTPAREVLNTLKRWYDVEIVYEGAFNLPKYPFTGEITPGMKIKTVIDIMHHQYSGLHLKYDSVQNKIVVLP